MSAWWEYGGLIQIEDVVEMEAMRGPVRGCVGRGGDFVDLLHQMGPVGVMYVARRGKRRRPLGIDYD
jgi:hypothetical protein